VKQTLKLGVNIDHVATLRQARYALMAGSELAEPSVLEAARACAAAGADSITIHLRLDRRHIQDQDVDLLRQRIRLPLNLELGNSPEIVERALDTRPASCCLVPENRQEITTEGGLDVVREELALRPTIAALQQNGSRVSLFIDPDLDQVQAAARLGADMVELHTGAFASVREGCTRELERLKRAAEIAHSLRLQVNAGHGIHLCNLPRLLEVPHLAELNVGHSLVSRAIFIGLQAAVEEMLALMKHGRSRA
jgi:pyridoxine 5-phosphate synthase